MVFFLFLTGGLSLLWFIIGLKMKKTDPNNEIEKIYPSYWHLIIAIMGRVFRCTKEYSRSSTVRCDNATS